MQKPTCRIAEYDAKAGCDTDLPRLMRMIRQSIIKNDDDCVIVNGGDTGSGKSTLSGLQYYHYSRPFPLHPEAIVLTSEEFAHRLASLPDIEPKECRVLVYDEAQLSKRRGMSSWNHDVMTLYGTIRGLNSLHIWNNPDVEMLDKEFIKTRLNILFYVLDKHKDKPRRYLLFRRADILKFIEKHKLHKKNLVSHGEEFAYYMGAFRRFDHPVMERYKDIKAAGMADAVNKFKEKYGYKEPKKRGRPKKNPDGDDI
jgi:hypothetical protein